MPNLTFAGRWRTQSQVCFGFVALCRPCGSRLETKFSSRGLGHRHKTWGRQGAAWATAEEAAYPPVLCRHWATLVAEHLEATGTVIDEGLVQGTQRFAAAERAALGFFPKATHAPVCVEPFQDKEWLELSSAADRTKFVPGTRLNDPSFPKGSTTIKVTVQNGRWWALVGQPVEPEAFLRKAAERVHPSCSLPRRLWTA